MKILKRIIIILILISLFLYLVSLFLSYRPQPSHLILLSPLTNGMSRGEPIFINRALLVRLYLTSDNPINTNVNDLIVRVYADNTNVISLTNYIRFPCGYDDILGTSNYYNIGWFYGGILSSKYIEVDVEYKERDSNKNIPVENGKIWYLVIKPRFGFNPSIKVITNKNVVP